MTDAELAQRLREAGDRRAILAEFGLPSRTGYQWVEESSTGPGAVTARYGAVLDGQHALLTHHPLREVEGKSWPRPYRVVVYGVDAAYRDAISEALAARGVPTRGRTLPVIAFHPWGTGGDPVPLLLLRLTAHHPDTPLYAERRLRADLGWEDSLRGLQHPYEAKQRTLAEKGLPLLREWPARHAGGRPLGTKQIRPELFREVAPVLWREYVAVWGHIPSDTAFARHIGMAPTTFGRRLKECREQGMQWPPDLTASLRQFLESRGQGTPG